MTAASAGPTHQDHGSRPKLSGSVERSRLGSEGVKLNAIVQAKPRFVDRNHSCAICTRRPSCATGYPGRKIAEVRARAFGWPRAAGGDGGSTADLNRHPPRADRKLFVKSGGSSANRLSDELLGSAEGAGSPTLLRHSSGPSRSPRTGTVARCSIDSIRVTCTAGAGSSGTELGTRSQRQPSAGATWARTFSMTWALYSTPSWLGTVRSSVSAAWIASSMRSCSTSNSGSAA